MVLSRVVPVFAVMIGQISRQIDHQLEQQMSLYPVRNKTGIEKAATGITSRNKDLEGNHNQNDPISRHVTP